MHTGCLTHPLLAGKVGAKMQLVHTVRTRCLFHRLLAGKIGAKMQLVRTVRLESLCHRPLAGKIGAKMQHVREKLAPKMKVVRTVRTCDFFFVYMRKKDFIRFKFNSF